jgi:outer membrane protein assembly factor BamB
MIFKRPPVSLIVCVILSGIFATARAADWPQWRGPARDGISKENGWSVAWPKEGPKQVWKINVGLGESSVSVLGGCVYTMGNEANSDSVFCLDAETGAVRWKHTYTCPRGGEFEGPRCTPAVDSENVFTCSRDGQIFCLDAKKGSVVWSKDLKKDFEVKPPYYGLSTSPLLDGKNVIFMAGSKAASVVAFERATGNVVWKSGADRPGYASPVPFTSGDKRAIAIFTGAGLSAVNLDSGQELWRHPWSTQGDINAAEPIVLNNKFFISSAYNAGCELIDPSGETPRVVWQNKEMRNHFNSCVLIAGCLYGMDGNATDMKGNLLHDVWSLKCVDFETGTVKWKQPKLFGTLMAADGKLIILTMDGRLVIAEVSPEKYTELASAAVLSGTTYTTPVLCNGKIYCRAAKGDLVCVDVK